MADQPTDEKERTSLGMKILGWALMLGIFLLFELGLHLFRPMMDLQSLPPVLNTSTQDGMVVVDAFTLKNKAYIGLKDPVVRCEEKGQSGTVIATLTKTVYQLIPAENSLAFESLVMGKADEQAATVSCKVTSISVTWPWS